MTPHRLATLIALALGLTCCAVSTPRARAADCRHVDAVFYSTDSVRLAQRLQANGSSCADYYISATPGGADGTGVRTGVAGPIHLNGPNFHAMAEIRFNATAWGSWVVANHATWFDAGVEARRRMQAAGYDVASGDTWALNELSPDVLANTGTARADVREFIRGLYTGDGTMPVSPGVVFVTDPLQITGDLAQYKQQLQDWFGDTAFWSDMSHYVRFWGQETYADTRNWGVAGASLETRRDYLNDYLQHALLLVRAGPGSVDTARTFLERAYTPIANAAYPRVPVDAAGTGFGNTAVPASVMESFISSETYAMRFFSGTNPGTDSDRLGFAWSPNTMGTGVPAATFVELLDRLAGSISLSASGDPADPGVGACGPDLALCDGAVDSAQFNDAWKGLGAWSPVTNTPAGSDVHVQVDPGVTVTFASVSSSGSTQSSSSATGAPPPAGVQLQPGSLYYDLGTTAAFDGPADVCIGYGDADYTGLTPRLYHFADSEWSDITTSIDRSSQTICGRSSSLSLFAVFAAGPPALTVPDRIVLPATGPDGAVVTYVASATSVFDPSPDVSCAPPAGSVFAIGTTTVSCRATDSGGGTATADFDVEVSGAGPQLAELSSEVDDATGLPGGTKVALLVHLKGALEYLDRDDLRHACLRLGAFERLVQNLERAGIITPTPADQWIGDARRIESVLAC